MLFCEHKKYLKLDAGINIGSMQIANDFKLTLAISVNTSLIFIKQPKFHPHFIMTCHPNEGKVYLPKGNLKSSWRS
ncbi:hypothetical protein NIES2119_17680 [[Phormidium ambiguum] IAM M-71]|uniref:Uncharacterized protein n=1 Tax=[Phormidium ambiguum] IAM M-71 TaxID=454136 RepID=A0A1U7IGD4_9CYAN|nr:hypothetical protein NIES2119_17680 [Phormidium ambiguum IAM M-71]